MFLLTKRHRFKAVVDEPILGRTLPSLLDEVCDCNHLVNHQAFNQWTNHGWQSQSSSQLRTAVEELALGLKERGLEPRDHIALLMHSDVNFCLADFASLLIGAVNVPIDLTQTLDNIAFILNHSAAKVLIVSDLDLLAQIVPYLVTTPSLQTIIVADPPDDWEEKRMQLLTCGVEEFGIRNSKFGVRNPEMISSEFKVSESQNTSQNLVSSIFNAQEKTTNSELKTPNSPQACLCIPMLLCQARPDLHCPELPHCIQLYSVDEVRDAGKKLWSEKRVKKLRDRISSQDLATIVYIPGESGEPKGVMLSHENISSDILTTFANIPELQPGKVETVLSFLPLTHIFARAFIYGHLNYGHSIYFSTPNRAARDFKTVKPTLVATVPRLLEKIYQKMCDRGGKLKGSKQAIFNWALNLAQSYELGKPRTLSYDLQLKLANLLVFTQVRKPFGGRLKYFISGGAALKAEIANVLSGAGMTVLQGYGLTETSSVICCNQDNFNRAGTVGLPIPGVEIAIAPDQEILVKAPYVMQGYYHDPDATKAVIDKDGWLHTGDLGEFTPEGFLTITGSKKELFKLSTGKYVTPQPLEAGVKRSPLVAQAVVVGRQQKFCGMLIFPNLEGLKEQAPAMGLHLPTPELLQQPEIIALYQTLVDEANEKLPLWSKVKQFQLVDAELTVANGLLQQNLKVNRAKVSERFATEINALYGEKTFDSLGSAIVTTSRSTKSAIDIKNYLPRLNLIFWLIDNIRSAYSRLYPDLFKRQSILAKRSLKRLNRRIVIKARLTRKRIQNWKNRFTLPSNLPWNLPEENHNHDSEELESIEGRKA